MKRSLRVLLAISMICVATLASDKSKPQKMSVSVDGKDRTYYVLTPENLTSPAPLLLLLHGSGRDGMSQIDAWKNLAEKEGVILVAPDSANSREWAFPADGPDFLHDVVEAVRAKYPVDGKRLYLFGHSAGAVFGLYNGIMDPGTLPPWLSTPAP